MPSTIGSRIRKYRQDSGMNLLELAEKACVSKGYLWQLEEGETSNPTMQTLIQIAKALDKTIAELMYGNPLIKPKKNSKVNDLPNSLQEFIRQCKVEKQPLTEDDIEMLASISFRGKRPKKSKDWETLFNLIRIVSKSR